jgi:hypothetical protein
MLTFAARPGAWLTLLLLPCCDAQRAESPARTPAPALAPPPSWPLPRPVADADRALLEHAAAGPVTAGGDPAPTRSPVGAEKSPSDPAAPAKTIGRVELKREGPPALLQAVRAASGLGYDRVVFEFRDSVPGYHIEYIDKPVRDCGAGDVRAIEGDGWLEVRLYPANAHTAQGEATISERELRPRLPIVREIERTCDFEAVVTWVIGTASPHRYSAFELAAPPRLVVDIDH